MEHAESRPFVRYIYDPKEGKDVNNIVRLDVLYDEIFCELVEDHNRTGNYKEELSHKCSSLSGSAFCEHAVTAIADNRMVLKCPDGGAVVPAAFTFFSIGSLY